MAWLCEFVWLGVAVCCAGADEWLGAELWAGALAWGAGALACGAGAELVLCWAMANAGTSTTSANKACFRRPLSFIIKFIANSWTQRFHPTATAQTCELVADKTVPITFRGPSDTREDRQGNSVGHKDVSTGILRRSNVTKTRLEAQSFFGIDSGSVSKRNHHAGIPLLPPHGALL